MSVAQQSELPFEQSSGLRAFDGIAQSPLFQGFILLCIVANAITLGIDANYGPEHWIHRYIENMDRYFLAIFTVELVIEFLAAGPRRYVRNPWNIFDVIVVGLSYVAMTPAISALRTLRILRVLRLVSAVPQMRRVVEALFGAMPGILATTAILGVVFYIGAVMATSLFGQTHAQFHDLGRSTLTLFALTQFDGWGDMVTDLNQTYPWAWAFILGFTVIAAFAVLNLFIGVIVDAVQETRGEVVAAIKDDVKDIEGNIETIEEGVEDLSAAQSRSATDTRMILAELQALRGEVSSLRAQLNGPRSF